MPSKQAKEVQARLAQERIDAGFPESWSWTWDPSLFLNGVPERRGEKHSRYFRAILAKHPVTTRDKSPSVLIPFLKSTLSKMEVDPLHVSLHCEMQRQEPKKLQSYMGDMLAELCRYRVPGHSDQGFMLYKSVCDKWEAPETISGSSISRAQASLSCTKPADYVFSDAEGAIIEHTVAQWRKLVPTMSDESLQAWLHRELQDNKSDAICSLPRDLLIGAMAYKLNWLWVPSVNSSAQREGMSRSISRLRNALQRHFKNHELSESTSTAPSIRPQHNWRFSTVAGDRARLLQCYQKTQAPTVSAHDVLLRLMSDLFEGVGIGKVEKAAACQQIALEWDPSLSRLEVQGFIAQAKSYLRSESLGKRHVATWSSSECCWYLKFAFELGTEAASDICKHLQARGIHLSYESVASSHNDSVLANRIASHALMVQQSCPRWWKALMLDADPLKAWAEWRGRGTVYEVVSSDLVQVQGRFDELCELDAGDSALPAQTLVSLAEIIDFATTQHFELGDSPLRLKEKTATEIAVIRNSMSSFIQQ